MEIMHGTRRESSDSRLEEGKLSLLTPALESIHGQLELPAVQDLLPAELLSHYLPPDTLLLSGLTMSEWTGLMTHEAHESSTDDELRLLD